MVYVKPPFEPHRKLKVGEFIDVTITAADAQRLHLDPMVAKNDAPLGTAFTVTIDLKHGTTTGISAEERTNTVR